MAAKAKKASKPKVSKPQPKNGKETKPGIGHNNYRVDRKGAKEFFDRLDKLHRDKAESNAGYMSDIKIVYEEAGKKLGIPEKIVKRVYSVHRAEMRIQDNYANLETDEKDTYDGLVLALGSYASSPLGKAALERKERTEATAEIVQQDQQSGMPPAPDFED